MYVIITNPDGTRETATQPGQGYCFREAFDAVLHELKKGAVLATIYAENPTDAQFGGLGEHLRFTGAALPLMSFLLGATDAGSLLSEETSAEVASKASRILSLSPEHIGGIGDKDAIMSVHTLLDLAKSVAGSALTQKIGAGEIISVDSADDKIITTVEIDWEKVANAVVGAIESGYSPWFREFTVAEESCTLRAEIKNRGDIWYATGEFWQRGGKATLAYDVPDEDEGTFNGHAEFGKAEIQRGLQIMAVKYPRHFADLMSENDDAATHDVFMQCAILEDVIYG